jgi:aminomethyltransferase
MAVRKAFGVFDVSHMGKVRIHGDGAREFVSRIQTNLPPEVGKNNYGHFLNEQGIIIDDTIVGNLGDTYLSVPNAATKDLMLDWFKKHANPGVKLDDMTDQWFCIAIQGPKAADAILSAFGIDTKPMPFMTSTYVTMKGEKVVLSRSGYTGEDGVEFLGPNKLAEWLFSTILETGKAVGAKPCGLGARDTLRLEKGMLLSGQDFHMDRTPLETNCSWVVKWDHDFIGKAALLKQKETLKVKLKGIKMANKGAIPRHGSRVFVNGAHVTDATSGSYSPVLGLGIAMAYLDKSVTGKVEVEVRGKPEPGEIVKMPFV